MFEIGRPIGTDIASVGRLDIGQQPAGRGAVDRPQEPFDERGPGVRAAQHVLRADALQQYGVDVGVVGLAGVQQCRVVELRGADHRDERLR